MWRFSTLFVLVTSSALVNSAPRVPCFFIFGDSYSDPGNNNELVTLARANYTPYGVDFPGGIPTGRFTNGLTVVDYISRFLGFDRFITAYRTLTDQDLLRGVNFASGCAGILPQTAIHVGARLSMDEQLQDYKSAILKLESMVQGPTSSYLNKCLYFVDIGANDYINNYFLPLLYPTKLLFNTTEYALQLIDRYKSHLQALYNSGARKIVAFGLGQLGCIPFSITENNATLCIDEINEAVDIFNTKLVSLVYDFNAKLVGAKVTFVNVSAIQTLVLYPTGVITNSSCCKVGINTLCEPSTPPCANRDLYAFMDAIHPTEVMNKQVASISFGTKSSLFARPMNINKLIST